MNFDGITKFLGINGIMKFRDVTDGRRSPPSKHDNQTNAECRPADQGEEHAPFGYSFRRDEGHKRGEEQKERIQRDEVIIWHRNLSIVGFTPAGNNPGEDGADTQRDDNCHNQMTYCARLLRGLGLRIAHDETVVARGGNRSNEVAGTIAFPSTTWERGGISL